jgi:hypothetical protein
MGTSTIGPWDPECQPHFVVVGGDRYTTQLRPDDFA